MNQRRDFLKKAAASAALLSVPQLVSRVFASEKTEKLKLEKNDIILFQGDSITDAGRVRDDMNANSPKALGGGYGLVAASILLNKYPERNFMFYNRGVSGNKVFQLAERWDAECIALKPSVLSILVGVNDYWHTLTNNYTGTIQTYHDDYKKLIEQTLQKLPGLRLVIGEPYAVNHIKAVDDKWYPAFNAYQQAAKELAKEFNAVFIPYQKLYDEAQKSAPGAYWTADGVHPTLAGCGLMAHAWIEAVNA